MKDSLLHSHQGRNTDSSHLCGRSFRSDSAPHFATEGHPFQRMSAFWKIPKHIFIWGASNSRNPPFYWHRLTFWSMLDDSNTTGLVFSFLFSWNGLKTFPSTLPALPRRDSTWNIFKVDHDDKQWEPWLVRSWLHVYENVILSPAKVNFQLTVPNRSNNFNSLQLNSSLVITKFRHF